MKFPCSVLLVHSEPEAFRGIEEMLKGQEIETRHASRCSEALRFLKDVAAVDVVLTDVAVPDGTWKDVMRLVRKHSQNLPVIVMSRVVSMRLYLDTQDGGAADFIVPPMAPRDLAYTLTTAMNRTPQPGIFGAAAHTKHTQHQPAIH